MKYDNFARYICLSFNKRKKNSSTIGNHCINNVDNECVLVSVDAFLRANIAVAVQQTTGFCIQ